MNDASTTKPRAEAPEQDWTRFDAMSDAERTAAAMADPDAQPILPGDEVRMPRTPQVKVIRRALGLSLEEFATRYKLGVDEVRAWEDGSATPDSVARAYLHVIAREPDVVLRALAERREVA